jgi:hypothetical protein
MGFGGEQGNAMEKDKEEGKTSIFDFFKGLAASGDSRGGTA